MTGDDATSVRAREDGSGEGEKETAREKEREKSQTRGENGEDDRPIPAEVTVLT